MMTDHRGFETITEVDHRAWLWVVSVLSLTYSLICFAARLTGKWDLLWWDDGILGLAYLFAFAHYGLLSYAICEGLGASASLIPTYKLDLAAQYYFISRIPAFIALCLSKISVIAFTRRIFSGNLGSEQVAFGVAYCIIALYGIGAVLLSSAGCHPNKALRTTADAVCDGNIIRWSLITGLDVLTEIILLALPIWFISKNQIKASKKRIVVFVFSFRLLVAGLSIAATDSYSTYLEGANLSIGAAPTVAWQETLLGFSLISASIPCLRAFLRAFMSTGLMTAYGTGVQQSYGSRSGSNIPNPGQAKRESHQTISKRDGGQRLQPLHLRPDLSEYSVDIRKGSAPIDRRASKSNTVDGIEQMSIVRNVEIAIERS